MDRGFSVARVAKALIVTAVLLTWAHVLLTPPPRLPTAFANGRYYNACCGLVVLSNGKGSSKSGAFSYVVEKDRAPYVLPTDRAVIATPKGISILPRKPDLFIRTDASPRPQWIDIIGPQADYRFTRRDQ